MKNIKIIYIVMTLIAVSCLSGCSAANTISSTQNFFTEVSADKQDAAIIGASKQMKAAIEESKNSSALDKWIDDCLLYSSTPKTKALYIKRAEGAEAFLSLAEKTLRHGNEAQRSAWAELKTSGAKKALEQLANGNHALQREAKAKELELAAAKKQ